MMHVIDHTTLKHERMNGRVRVSVANSRLGVASLEVWLEVLDPHARGTFGSGCGAQSVALVMSGRGRLSVDDMSQHFSAPASLILPGGCECEVVNMSAEPMQLVVAFGTSCGNELASLLAPG